MSRGDIRKLCFGKMNWQEGRIHREEAERLQVEEPVRRRCGESQHEFVFELHEQSRSRRDGISSPRSSDRVKWLHEGRRVRKNVFKCVYKRTF